MNYEHSIPRGDNVLVRLVKKGKSVGGVHIPATSFQGNRYLVVACGPKVEGLAPGDFVMMTGQQKVDWDFLPLSGDMIVIREANILLVIKDAPPEVAKGESDAGTES